MANCMPPTRRITAADPLGHLFEISGWAIARPRKPSLGASVDPRAGAPATS